MMGSPMYRNAYAEAAAGDQTESRRREHAVLDRVVSQLRTASRRDANRQELDAALDAVDALWTIFLADLSNKDNALPEDLRARLISIGLWALQAGLSIRSAGCGDLAALIDVHSAIRDGLKR